MKRAYRLSLIGILCLGFIFIILLSINFYYNGIPVSFPVPKRFITGYAISDITGTTYYVSSSSGNDANNGTSQAYPIKTIQKLNTLALLPGDGVLFKAGDTWRRTDANGAIVFRSGNSSNKIIYGSYGTGKAIMLGSINATNVSDWVNDTGKNNTWRYTHNYSIETGNIIFNSESVVGVIELAKENLSSQGEFFWNETTNTTYVYSDRNPASYYGSIELATESVIFNLHNGEHDILIENFDIKYSGYNGIDLHETYNIKIKNNEFSYIGGGLSGQEAIFGYASRWGNAIEIWEDNYNILIENNSFNQIYDQSIGIEGSAEAGAYSQYNIIFRNNIISNTEGCWIFFQQDFNLGYPGIINSILKNLTIEYNTCYDIGNTWANGQRYGNNIGRCFWLGGMEGTSAENGKNIIIKNNICYLNNGNFISKSPWAHSNNASFDYNLYFKANADNNPLVNWNGIQLFNSFSQYKTNLSQDLHSAEANPLFVDPATNDFRLSYDSLGCSMSSTGGYVGAVGCSSPPLITICGDDVCEGNETIENCEHDCDTDDGDDDGNDNGNGVQNCTPLWNCTWSACLNHTQNSSCYDLNICNDTSNKPANSTRSCNTTQVITNSDGSSFFSENLDNIVYFAFLGIIILGIFVVIVFIRREIIKPRTDDSMVSVSYNSLGSNSFSRQA